MCGMDCVTQLLLDSGSRESDGFQPFVPEAHGSRLARPAISASLLPFLNLRLYGFTFPAPSHSRSQQSPSSASDNLFCPTTTRRNAYPAKSPSNNCAVPND